MKDIVIRAAKTFVQAAFGCLAAACAAGIDITSGTAVTGLVVSVVAAGVSAVMNLFVIGYKEGMPHDE